MAEHAPAYVVYGTPKPQFPTLCFIPREGHAPTCTSAQPHLFRLCPCVTPAAGELLTDTIGSEDEAGEEAVGERGAGQEAREKVAKGVVAKDVMAKEVMAKDVVAKDSVVEKQGGRRAAN